MSAVENYIRNHRPEFEDSEPAPGHLQRFEALLNAGHGGMVIGIRRPLLLKIAAILLLLITITVFLFDLKTRSLRYSLGFGIASVELPSEVKEAMQYYDGLAINQLNEIDKITGKDQKTTDLNITARRELQSLDENTAELKKAFSESPYNERIIAALIQNQQMKEKVTNTILAQLTQSKK